MLRAIADGREDPEKKLANFAQRRLKQKKMNLRHVGQVLLSAISFAVFGV